MRSCGKKNKIDLAAALLGSTLLCPIAPSMAQPVNSGASASASPQAGLNRFAFNLPAKPLARAIADIGGITGYRIAYGFALPAGATSRPVRGTFNAPEALAQALSGTGLSYRATGQRALVLVQSSPEPNTSDMAGAVEDGSVRLDPIEVGSTGSGLVVDGYVPLDSTAGTKTETPIIETPQSVSVVTREQLDDRNVQTLDQALNYTSGLRIGAFGFDPRFDSFYLRGFDMTYIGIYRDGLRQAAGPFSIFKTEPYGLDAVTVIKGPSSAVYGSGSAGGLIDLITKRPTFVPLAEAQLQIGNYNRYQGNFDFGGPIDPEGTQAVRVTGLFRNSDTWLVGVKDDRAYIAPAFTWRPDEQTSFTFLSEYLNSVTTGNPGFYQTPEGALTRIFQGDPRFTDFNQEQFRLGYQFEHKFNENLAVRQNARYSYVFADAKYTQIDFIDPDSWVASRSTGRVINHLDTFGVDNQLFAKFSTGPLEHAVLAGLEYNFAHFDDKVGFGLAPDLDLSVANPGYGAQPIPGPAVYDFRSSQTQAQIGIYLQDQAKWGPWILTIGGRNDWVRTNSRDDVAILETAQEDQAATGRVGLTYLAPFGFAPYFSYATAFTPTIGFDAKGQPFNPVTGNQKEVGIKYQPPGVNALITAAFFEINQSNSLVTDPEDFAFQIQRGKIRSRGFELEGVASLGPGINVTAAYTLLDLRFVDGDPETIGKVPSGIPSQTFSIWGDYTFQPDSPLAGFGGGFGMRYIGPNFATDTNTIKTEQATLFDAMLRYDLAAIDPRLSGVRLQVNAQNLLDTEYQTCQVGFCYWGPRRTVIGSLRYRF